MNVEDERVKSALEIAMERISGLPELTPEEIAEQKEKEYRPAGEALACRYIQGIVDGHNIPTELSRHPGDSGHIIRRAFISHLCRAIQLDDIRTAVRAMDGLCSLAGGTEGLRERANASWARVLDGFQRQKNSSLKECEASERERLAAAGISGSAVRPNLEQNESLKRSLKELQQSFEPELEKLRSMFLQNLQTE